MDNFVRFRGAPPNGAARDEVRPQGKKKKKKGGPEGRTYPGRDRTVPGPFGRTPSISLEARYLSAWAAICFQAGFRFWRPDSVIWRIALEPTMPASWAVNS